MLDCGNVLSACGFMEAQTGVLDRYGLCRCSTVQVRVHRGRRRDAAGRALIGSLWARRTGPLGRPGHRRRTGQCYYLRLSYAIVKKGKHRSVLCSGICTLFIISHQINTVRLLVRMPRSCPTHGSVQQLNYRRKRRAVSMKRLYLSLVSLSSISRHSCLPYNLSLFQVGIPTENRLTSLACSTRSVISGGFQDNAAGLWICTAFRILIRLTRRR